MKFKPIILVSIFCSVFVIGAVYTTLLRDSCIPNLYGDCFPKAISDIFPDQKSNPDSNDNIRITAPAPDTLIKSPLLVKGEARGSWYFEASFPIRLLDANDNQVAVIPAQALGEWMTGEFVPFEAELIFEKPATKMGTLVLQKDNPSGLPENDDSVSIPVRFY